MSSTMGLVAWSIAASPLDGTWTGTETCVDNCGNTPGHHQGTVQASLVLSGGKGTYSVGKSKIVPNEFDGSFLRGNLTTPEGKLHGFIMLATSNGQHAYGSFYSATSKRLFHWEFNSTIVPPPAPPTPAPPSPGVTIYEQNLGGYYCHRVPSVVNTGKSILVFVESRRTSCGDQVPKDVNVRRSTDGGRTWGPLIRVLGDTVPTNNSQTFRNPTALHHTFDNGSSVILINVVNSTEKSAASVTWPSLQLRSYDDGLTWSKPERVVGMGKYEGVLAGPGTGIQLGRHSATNRNDPVLRNRILYCGATGYQAGHAMYGVVWYSDDGGKKWVVSSTVFTDMQECQLAELESGDLMINFRNAHLNKTCECRAVSRSTDGGVTWSPVTYDPALIEPTCSAGLINVAAPQAGANDVLFFSNPADTSHRDKMTIRRSDDSGQTWPTSKLVWPGPAAYSALVPVNESHIGLAFENGEAVSTHRISFVALPTSFL